MTESIREQLMKPGLFPELDKKYSPKYKKISDDIDELEEQMNKKINKAYEEKVDNKTNIDKEYEDLLNDAYGK